MAEIFHHNGKEHTTEAEYFASVVKNGEVRNAVSLAAARYYYNRCLALYEMLGKQNFGEGSPERVEEFLPSALDKLLDPTERTLVNPHEIFPFLKASLAFFVKEAGCIEKETLRNEVYSELSKFERSLETIISGAFQGE
jgi:hypothetical protein